MSVDVQLIDEKFHYEAEDDGSVSFADGEHETGDTVIYGYSISVAGVLTITATGFADDGHRFSFTYYEFGPSAWANVFGTEQTRIKELDDLELRALISEAESVEADTDTEVDDATEAEFEGEPALG
ncbi:hypothetical protein [Aldersonia kunmingensis]|uniref:hypothetical protein n=1 Tax=Aldersonia kunmingensis TaxID=408066 RepID=UPI000831E769|nr:hypothetical protein [Aldersonia kunmingensis]